MPKIGSGEHAAVVSKSAKKRGSTNPPCSDGTHIKWGSSLEEEVSTLGKK